MTSQQHLVAWLRQQLDLDEASEWPHRPSCQMLKPVPAGFPGFGALFTTFSCNCDAATRWMQEFEAKRRILDVLEEQRRQAERNSQKYVEAMRSPRGGPADDLLPGIKTHGWTLGGRVEALEEVMKLLALPYSGRPGYREEWKP
jgi:hypothetical protein